MHWKQKILTFALLFAATLQAVPWYAPTGLPMKGMFKETPEDAELAAKLVKGLLEMRFHKDTEDPDLYYIVPVFRAVPGTVAGTPLINYKQLERLREMLAADERIAKAVNDAIASRAPQMEKLRLAIEEELSKPKPDLERVERLKKYIAEEETRLSSSPAVKAHVDRLSTLLAMSQIATRREESLMDANTRNYYISQAAAASGGELTVNATANLSREETATLREYVLRRTLAGLPAIKLQTMPLGQVKFTGVLERDPLGAEKATGVSIFRRIAGAGNFKAATLSLDLSGDGAAAFGTAPPPVILPVAIEGKALVKFPTFKARLSCKFEEWIKLNYEGKVVDGGIWNDVIDERLVPFKSDRTTEPCWVDVEGGRGDEETKAARFTALLKLQEKLIESFLTRVQAGNEELKKYEEELRRSTKARTREGGVGNNAEIVDWYIHSTHVNGHRIWGPHKGRRLMIHKNTVNLDKLKKLELDIQITDRTYSEMNLDLPTQLCLAYHPGERHYVACTTKELDAGDSVMEAKKNALSSEECRNTTSLEECRQNREKNAPKFEETGNIAPSSEDSGK